MDYNNISELDKSVKIPKYMGIEIIRLENFKNKHFNYNSTISPEISYSSYSKDKNRKLDQTNSFDNQKIINNTSYHKSESKSYFSKKSQKQKIKKTKNLIYKSIINNIKYQKYIFSSKNKNKSNINDIINNIKSSNNSISSGKSGKKINNSRNISNQRLFIERLSDYKNCSLYKNIKMDLKPNNASEMNESKNSSRIKKINKYYKKLDGNNSFKLSIKKPFKKIQNNNVNRNINSNNMFINSDNKKYCYLDIYYNIYNNENEKIPDDNKYKSSNNKLSTSNIKKTPLNKFKKLKYCDKAHNKLKNVCETNDILLEKINHLKKELSSKNKKIEELTDNVRKNRDNYKRMFLINKKLLIQNKQLQNYNNNNNDLYKLKQEIKKCKEENENLKIIIKNNNLTENSRNRTSSQIDIMLKVPNCVFKKKNNNSYFNSPVNSFNLSKKYSLINMKVYEEDKKFVNIGM